MKNFGTDIVTYSVVDTIPGNGGDTQQNQQRFNLKRPSAASVPRAKAVNRPEGPV